MSDDDKRTVTVIHQHLKDDQMFARRARRKLETERHERNFEMWQKVVQHGGTIVCRSFGAAVNIRQSLYATRKLWQEAEGQSLWDHLVIRLEKGSNRLEVMEAASNVVEIIPATGQDDPADYAGPGSKDTYIVPGLTPNHPGRQYPPAYNPAEDEGRPPITPDQIFGDPKK